MELAEHETSQNGYIKPFVETEEGTIVNKKAIASGKYPLTRRLYLVVRDDDTLDSQAGYVYYDLLKTPKGQKFVEQTGIVPIS